MHRIRSDCRRARGGFLLGLALFLAWPAATPADEAPPLDEVSASPDAALLDAMMADFGEPADPPPQAAARSAFWQSMNPDISLILDVAAAWFSADDPRMTGGHDPSATGFHLQQLEVALSGSVDPYFRFDGNLVFSLFGVELEEAYGTTLGLPAGLQARVGQFLTRFGRINATHPHSWDFVDQMFTHGRYFGGENLRGLGAELSWLSPLPWYVELVGTVQNADGGATMRSFYGGNNLGVHGPGDLLYTTAIKQFWAFSDDWSLLGGASLALGPNGTGPTARTDIAGLDAYLKWRPADRPWATVALQAEWLARQRQVVGDRLRDHGGYAYLWWRFARRWAAAWRYEYGGPAHNLAGRVVADDLDPDWLGERHRAAANITFWGTEFSRFRLQANHDIMTWRPEAEWGLMLAVELVAGAHGSHAF